MFDKVKINILCKQKERHEYILIAVENVDEKDTKTLENLRQKDWTFTLRTARLPT